MPYPSELRRKEYQQQFRRDNREKILLQEAKKRARNRKVPFNLTLADIVIPTHCPVLGIPLAISQGEGGGPKAGSPTLDRFKPSEGYVSGNVHVISYRANILKSDGTIEELEAVLRYLKGLT